MYTTISLPGSICTVKTPWHDVGSYQYLRIVRRYVLAGYSSGQVFQLADERLLAYDSGRDRRATAVFQVGLRIDRWLPPLRSSAATLCVHQKAPGYPIDVHRLVNRHQPNPFPSPFAAKKRPHAVVSHFLS